MRDPLVLRLVEHEGRAARARVLVPGTVARAARTSLLGKECELLEPRPALGAEARPFGAEGPAWSVLELELAPHEIATLMLDLELARQVSRRLDEHRHIWATVHRRDGEHRP